MPGAGGTQRLPRVLGVEAALNMIVSGEPVQERNAGRWCRGKNCSTRWPAAADTLAEEALALARKVPWLMPRPLPLVRNLPCQHPQGDGLLPVCAQHGQGHGQDTFRRRRSCVDAVEAATTQKFDEGMATEREIFMQPDAGRLSATQLRHLFHGRARGLQDSGCARRHPAAQRSQSVAVIGAGTMGGGIAMNFLNAGIPVMMLGDEAGGAGPRRGHHPQELRSAGQEGQAQAGQVRRSAWPCSRTTLSY